jgi:hypothetical protein
MPEHHLLAVFDSNVVMLRFGLVIRFSISRLQFEMAAGWVRARALNVQMAGNFNVILSLLALGEARGTNSTSQIPCIDDFARQEGKGEALEEYHCDRWLCIMTSA